MLVSLDAPIFNADRDGWGVRFADGAMEYPGDFLACMDRRAASQLAGTDCEIFKVHRDDWETVSRREPGDHRFNWYD